LPLEVLNARPDIAQSEADLKAAIAAIGVAEADFYPSFDLAANLTFGRTGVSSMNPTEVLIGSLTAVIEQVITDGGARSANREIAEAEAEEALADYELALRNAIQEVEASLNAIRASAARQDSLSKAVQASQRSFSQAETLYRQGLISFLDVVDAQQDLASDEQSLASERTDYAREIATLFNVLGAEIKTDYGTSR
jgi:multidrug efflux system outer membrane protein